MYVCVLFVFLVSTEIRRGRQIFLELEISEFEASLVYRVSSRTAMATQRNPTSKTTKITNNQTKDF